MNRPLLPVDRIPLGVYVSMNEFIKFCLQLKIVTAYIKSAKGVYKCVHLDSNLGPHCAKRLSCVLPMCQLGHLTDIVVANKGDWCWHDSEAIMICKKCYVRYKIICECQHRKEVSGGPPKKERKEDWLERFCQINADQNILLILFNYYCPPKLIGHCIDQGIHMITCAMNCAWKGCRTFAERSIIMIMLTINVLTP